MPATETATSPSARRRTVGVPLDINDIETLRAEAQEAERPLAAHLRLIVRRYLERPEPREL